MLQFVVVLLFSIFPMMVLMSSLTALLTPSSGLKGILLPNFVSDTTIPDSCWEQDICKIQGAACGSVGHV
jgi:hypothetical protein